MRSTAGFSDRFPRLSLVAALALVVSLLQSGAAFAAGTTLRVTPGSLSFGSEVSSGPRSLPSRVVSTWITRCAWKAPSETGADVWLSEIDEDMLLELMADFLYQIKDLPIEG